MTDTAKVRRRWLERLGQPVSLDFPFAAIEDVFRIAPGVTVATVEVGSGTLATSDRLDAVGFAATPASVEIVRIEAPRPENRDVTEIAFAAAGSIVGLHLAHDPEAAIVAGQCLAPAGRLESSARFEADVWCLSPDELPGTPAEQRQMCEAIEAGQGLELFFHSRSVPARNVDGPWRPALGAETVSTFELEAPVAIYPGVRFGVRYEALTFGAGFVRAAGA